MGTFDTFQAQYVFPNSEYRISRQPQGMQASFHHAHIKLPRVTDCCLHHLAKKAHLQSSKLGVSLNSKGIKKAKGNKPKTIAQSYAELLKNPPSQTKFDNPNAKSLILHDRRISAIYDYILHRMTKKEVSIKYGIKYSTLSYII